MKRKVQLGQHRILGDPLLAPRLHPPGCSCLDYCLNRWGYIMAFWMGRIS